MKNVALDLKDVMNLQNFSGIVPLFPLATVVFFPHTLLPLHVFEPRYTQMVNDVINNERIIGMVLLKPEWEKSYYANPPIYNVACMGRIVSSEALEDGKFNVILYGLKRVKILEIVKDIPYRLARVKPLEDVHGTNEQVYQKRISELISRWNDMLGKEQESHKINIDTELSLGNMTDALASLIVSNVFEKQKLLEEDSVQERGEKILNNLETRLEIATLTSRKRNQILQKRNLN
ncbi:MAG: LON peptidase substrate-binding domain-containing protein [Thermodesulfobacteriota bacterium]